MVLFVPDCYNNKKIFDLCDQKQDLTYFLSSDIRAEHSDNRFFPGPDEKLFVDDLKIETFLSTDLGVAFLVTVDGKTIFHAGDLHWWHWFGEPEENNLAMEHLYKSIISKLSDRPIDLAFLVLDPRQEEAYDWGFHYFLTHTDTAYAVPMHFFKDYSVIPSYLNSGKSREISATVLEITEEGQEFYPE